MFVVAERQAPILRLRIQNPPANLLSLEVMASLQAELDSAASDDAIRVIVIAAAGKLFSAGHDLKQMSAHRSDADGGESFFTETFAVCARLMQTIVNLPKPIIAEVDGIATAAGCQLVASCDLAVASERSRFGVNGIDVGLFCSTPAVALTRNVGRKHAMHMLLTGEMIDAATAEKFGLVNGVVSQESLSQVVDDYARIIADKSPSAIALGKAAVAQQSGMSLAEAYEHTSRIMVQNMLAADAKEGISAFLEKRQQRTVLPGPVEA
jgi:enoyl-CoA hydratase/carnithine racemase